MIKLKRKHKKSTVADAYKAPILTTEDREMIMKGYKVTHVRNGTVYRNGIEVK